MDIIEIKNKDFLTLMISIIIVTLGNCKIAFNNEIYLMLFANVCILISCTLFIVFNKQNNNYGEKYD